MPKLPNLPLSGQVRAIETPDKASRKVRNITAAVRGVSRLTGALADAAVRHADNEAQLDAADRVTSLQESLTLERRKLQRKYLDDDNLSMDQYLEEDEALIGSSIEKARAGVGGRTMRYMDSTLNKLRAGEQTLTSRYKFYDDTLQLRSTKKMRSLAQRNTASVYQNPDDYTAYADLTQVIDGVDLPAPVLDSIKTEFLTSLTAARVEGYLNARQPLRALDAINDEQHAAYLNGNYDTWRDQAVAMAGEEYTRTMESTALEVMRNPGTGEDTRQAIQPMLERYAAGTGAEIDALARSADSQLTVAELQGYLISDSEQIGLEKLDAGVFDDALGPAGVVEWRNKLLSGIDTKASSEYALFSDAVMNYEASLVQGGPVRPEFQQQLSAYGTDPRYTDKTAQIAITQRDLAVLEDNAYLFQDMGTRSVTELTANITDAQTLAEEGDVTTAATRASVANKAILANEQALRDLYSDPAKYAAANNPAVAQRYSMIGELLANAEHPEVREQLPHAFSMYIAETLKDQGRRGLVEGQTQLWPEDSPVIASYVAALDRIGDERLKLQTLSEITTLIPEAVRPEFMSELGQENTVYGSAMAFIDQGMLTAADMVLRGNASRTAANSSNQGKVIKDVDVAERYRLAYGGLPYQALGGNTDLLMEGLMDVYYAQPDANIATGSVNAEALDRAVQLTGMLPVSVTRSSVGARTLSYRRTETGQLVTPGQFNRQLDALSAGTVELPNGSFYSAEGQPMGTGEVLRSAMFIVQGNGQYSLVLQNSTFINGVVYAGGVFDSEGNEYMLDLNDIAIVSPALPEPFPTKGL